MTDVYTEKDACLFPFFCKSKGGTEEKYPRESDEGRDDR